MKDTRARLEASFRHNGAHLRGDPPPDPGDPDPDTDPEDVRQAIPQETAVEHGDAWEPTNGQVEKPTPQAPRFSLLTAAAFLNAEYRLEWSVKRLLVANQPGIVGGPKKALKTSLLVDLAFSLGTPAPFLGVFEVPQRRRVALFSGESGTATLQDTARRVCEARGIDGRNAEVFLGFDLPRLADPGDLGRLTATLVKVKADVCIIDPLYLSLLSGMDAAHFQASNLFHVGPLLLAVSRACLDAACTPILAHHFKLTRADQFGEPQLEDLAFAGIQEFARQWLLVGRRERYDPDSGRHALWLSAGGSAGHGGLWALDVDEGRMDDDFRGRTWNVTVTSATEARQAKESARSEAKEADRRQKERDDEARLLGALDQLDPDRSGVTLRSVREQAGTSGEKATRAAQRLVEDGILEYVPDMKVTTGNGASRPARGVRRVPEE